LSVYCRYIERGAKYDWDAGNRDHIARHGITPEEVEEALANAPILIQIEIDEVSGEDRFLELGITNAGRVLYVVWTPRDELTRPVTAWPAKRKVREEFYRTRKEPF
jgi:uncharacterized protein